MGYGLNPFTASQQGTLQVTLYDVLPHISSQVPTVVGSHTHRATLITKPWR